MSFIFLFTHAGEIIGMSSSIVEAKKRLHEEIIRTAEGTKDDDVLVVLKFIRNCLKKDYPFVQIFNPIDMDYVHLTSTIENKLQKVLDLTLAKSPSLTLAAKMKLDSAALSLVQRIREALSAQDVNQVSDIRQTIQYLRGYVEVDCFRHAISDSTKLIDEYIRMLRSTISDHVSRGTSSDREFNEENIKVLKEMLQQLKSLDCPDSANRSLQIAEKNVVEFADNIIAQACSFKHFHQGLKKVAVWAKGFEEFNPIYVRTCARITEFVHDMSSTLGRADISNIENWIDADILNVVRTLSSLNAMFEQSTQFPYPHLDVQTSINAINLAMQKLDSVFESWLSNTERFAKSSNFIEYENDLESIVKHVHTLEIILLAMTDQSPIFHPLDQHVRVTLKKLENHVLGRFNQCCATMKGTSFDPRWKSQLFWMRDVCSRFDIMNGICWKQTKSSFFAIIDAIKSSLHRASGELDNMSKMVDRSGMISGKSFANELKALESHQWIDSFLPADQKFISACCNRVREVVDKRIETNRALLELMIFISCVTPFKLIQNIGRMLPELLELGKYSEIAGGIRGGICCGLAPRCVTYLQSFTVYLSILAKKCLIFWSSNAKSGRRRIGYMRSITRKLNSILAVIEDLLITGASDIVLQESREIQTMLYDSFTEFNKAAQSEFLSLEGSFDTKSAYLVTIQACIGFLHVERQLINYRKVQQITRDLVSKEAAKLEASIEESSDWDRIDQSLLKFGVATVLDNFIGGDVTSRLRTLQRLRDQKEHQVDDLMATMIQNRDFKGIGEFLRPLSNSKDQVKRQKLESHLSVISSHLKEILHEIDRLIDINSNLTSNSRPVAKKIEVLIAAESDLGRLLSSQLNLRYELRKLRQCMNDFLCHFTEQITTATKDKDYIQMLRNIRQGNDFLSNMQHHLIQRNIGSFKSAVDKSKMELKAVPRYVKQFFESKFEDGDDLIKAMNSLKQVKGTGSFPKLAEKYKLEKKDFEAKVAQKIQSVKTIVSHSQCYDELIIYVHSLHRQLQGALKDHCSHHLVTECLRLTEELRCQKNCTDRFLELDGSYYHQNLDKLSHQLDTLSSPSIFEKVKIFFSSSSYDNKTYKRAVQ